MKSEAWSLMIKGQRSIAGMGWKGIPYVLMFTFTGSMLYFFCSKMLRTVASRPFKEDMLSAKRQLMGMLGVALPSNEILRLASRAPEGRCFTISGFDMIPSRRSRLASLGTEYSSMPVIAIF